MRVMNHKDHEDHKGHLPFFVTCVIVVVLVFGSVSAVRAATDADARLIEAAKAGQPAVVCSLLAQRADANAREADGTTALHWAVQADDRPTVAALLKVISEVSSVY